MFDRDADGQDSNAERGAGDESLGASREDAEEQAGQPGSEGQGGDDQATGNPDNAGDE